MTDVTKYAGIIPAFYACYDAEGNISPKAVREMTRWFIEKGVNGLYVGGSSGECIYQSKEERKIVLENVMAEAKGKITVIAHTIQQYATKGVSECADTLEPTQRFFSLKHQFLVVGCRFTYVF